MFQKKNIQKKICNEKWRKNPCKIINWLVFCKNFLNWTFILLMNYKLY